MKTILLGCSALAAMAPLQAEAATRMARFGSWTVSTAEKIPGHLATTVAIKVGSYSVVLKCVDARWTLNVSKPRPKGQVGAVRELQLTYSLDGAPPDRLTGQGHPSYKFVLDQDARAVVKDILAAKDTLSVAIEPDENMESTELSGTEEAIDPVLARCPI